MSGKFAVELPTEFWDFVLLYELGSKRVSLATTDKHIFATAIRGHLRYISEELESWWK